MKDLKEVLASIEALKRDLEELGVDVQVKVSLVLPGPDPGKEARP